MNPRAKRLMELFHQKVDVEIELRAVRAKADLLDEEIVKELVLLSEPTQVTMHVPKRLNRASRRLTSEKQPGLVQMVLDHLATSPHQEFRAADVVKAIQAEGVRTTQPVVATTLSVLTKRLKIRRVRQGVYMSNK